MTSTTPLSYESLKAVMQYMDANKRFELSKHCPSIRRTEKIVPLKIDKLQFHKHGLTVNKTEYRISTYLKYPEGMDIPPIHQSMNKFDVDYQELDEYGAVSKNQTIDLTPGDILVEEPRLPDDVSDEDQIEECSRSISRVEKDISLNTELGKKHLVKELTKLLDRLQSILQPLLYRRDNELPPYEVMVKLTMRTEKEWTPKIELVKKTMKMHEAIKRLTTFMFGGRRAPILVKHLEFDNYLHVLRLPAGLKLKVHDLLADQEQFEIIEPLIDESSFPLGAIHFRKLINKAEDLTHPWEKSAKKLVLMAEQWNYPRGEIIFDFAQREICLAGDRWEPKRFNKIFKLLIKQWREQIKEIGSSVSFEKREVKPRKVMEELQKLSEPFNGIKVDRRLITIPINHMSQFNVSFEVVDDYLSRIFGITSQEEQDDHVVHGIIKVIVTPV